MPRYVHGDGRTIDLVLDGRTLHDSVAGTATFAMFGEARKAYLARAANLVTAGFTLEVDDGLEAAPAWRQRPIGPLARHPELEAAIAAAPDDSGAYQVFADFLQTSNDPWGTLIALQLADRTEDADAFLESHADALLGELADAFHRGGLVLSWRWGFIRGAELGMTSGARRPPPEALRVLLAHRMASRLQTLEIAGSPLDAFIAHLIAAPQAAKLGALGLVGSAAPVDALPIVTGLPALELLSFVDLRVDRVSLDMPRLRYLHMMDTQLGGLLPGHAPRLASADLATHSNEGTHAEIAHDVAGWLAALATSAPKLTELGLAVVDDEWARAMLGVLAASPLADRIRKLRLRFVHEGPTTEAFRGHAELLARFDAIEIQGRRPLQDARRAIKWLVPNARFAT